VAAATDHARPPIDIAALTQASQATYAATVTELAALCSGNDATLRAALTAVVSVSVEGDTPGAEDCSADVDTHPLQRALRGVSLASPIGLRVARDGSAVLRINTAMVGDECAVAVAAWVNAAAVAIENDVLSGADSGFDAAAAAAEEPRAVPVRLNPDPHRAETPEAPTRLSGRLSSAGRRSPGAGAGRNRVSTPVTPPPPVVVPIPLRAPAAAPPVPPVGNVVIWAPTQRSHLPGVERLHSLFAAVNSESNAVIARAAGATTVTVRSRQPHVLALATSLALWGPSVRTTVPPGVVWSDPGSAGPEPRQFLCRSATIDAALSHARYLSGNGAPLVRDARSAAIHALAELEAQRGGEPHLSLLEALRVLGAADAAAGAHLDGVVGAVRAVVAPSQCPLGVAWVCRVHPQHIGTLAATHGTIVSTPLCGSSSSAVREERLKPTPAAVDGAPVVEVSFFAHGRPRGAAGYDYELTVYGGPESHEIAQLIAAYVSHVENVLGPQ
jgi:hypothetical protein